MKQKLLLMLLAFCLMAGVAQANMLKNPSFEDGYWTLTTGLVTTRLRPGVLTGSMTLARPTQAASIWS